MMTKFYIAFTKTTMTYSQSEGKMGWNTTNNCIASIDAETEAEAIETLHNSEIKYDGDKITNIKISTTNPMF